MIKIMVWQRRKEIINIDYAEALLSSEDPISMTIADSDSQDIIWQEHALALPVAGWKQYYVVEIDNQCRFIELNTSSCI